jgi:hypothetical protein
MYTFSNYEAMYTVVLVTPYGSASDVTGSCCMYGTSGQPHVLFYASSQVPVGKGHIFGLDAMTAADERESESAALKPVIGRNSSD